MLLDVLSLVAISGQAREITDRKRYWHDYMSIVQANFYFTDSQFSLVHIHITFPSLSTYKPLLVKLQILTYGLHSDTVAPWQ